MMNYIAPRIVLVKRRSLKTIPDIISYIIQLTCQNISGTWWLSILLKSCKTFNLRSYQRYY